MIHNETIGNANIAVMRAKAGRPTKGLLVIGRQRAERTALIGQVCKTLNAEDVYVVHVTTSKDYSFPAALGRKIQNALQRMSAHGASSPLVVEALRALAEFARSLKPRYPDIDITIGTEPESGVAGSSALEFHLTSLLEVIGAMATQAGAVYVMLIDEMHLVKGEQLSALIAALHRVAQRGLPVVLIGGGSPALRRRVGNAKPYAERMFDFIDLDERRFE